MARARGAAEAPASPGPFERRRRWAVRVLLGVLVGLVVHLVTSDPPWETGIAERTREGLPLRAQDFQHTWLWWTSLGNAVAVSLLLATRRWWLRDRPDPVLEQSRPRGIARPRAFALIVAAAMALAAAQASVRLPMSLWDDEEQTARRYVVGYHFVDEEGQVEFWHTRWRDALWNYSRINNHPFYSFLAQISTRTARAFSTPPPYVADERALRVPALLAGIAALPALALWLARLGYTGAGLLAAWLLMLHPWALRYTSEARGYSLLMLLLPVALLSMQRVLHRGSWGRWLWYSVPPLLMLWTYPPALLLVSVLHAATVVAVLRLHGVTSVGREQLLRFSIAIVLSALVFAEAMLPNIAQLAYEGYERRLPDLIADFPRNLASWFLAGMPWDHLSELPWAVPDPAGDYPKLSSVAASRPVLLAGVVGAVLAAAALGALRLLRAGWVPASHAIVVLLPLPLTFASLALAGKHPYAWHLVFVLPGLVALVALGFAFGGSVIRRVGSPHFAVAIAVAGLGAWGAGYVAVTQPARGALLRGSLQPLRESSAIARGTLEPLAPAAQGIVTAVHEDADEFYDPRARRIGGARDLRRLIREVEPGNELIVHVGRPEARLYFLLEDPDLFERVAVLRGFEPRLTRRVYRYRADPEAGADPPP